MHWSVNPSSNASLYTNDHWVNVPDTSISVTLPAPMSSFISYSISAAYSMNLKTGSIYDVSKAKHDNIVAFRILVDGIPFRQSGTSMGISQTNFSRTSGYLGIEMREGNHIVALQWRKRGSIVRSWRLVKNKMDGFQGGRLLLMSSHKNTFRYIQPLTEAILISSTQWHQVRDMKLRLNYDSQTRIYFFYQILITSESSPYTGMKPLNPT